MRATMCTVCRNLDGNRVHAAREMMWGTREAFRYLECAVCGSLELLDVPADMSPHYPPDYYSQQVRPRLEKGALHFARRLRARGVLRSPALARLAYREEQPYWLRWFQGLGLPSSVLDVGCGSGRTLFNLWQEGFSDLTGCDPYLRHPFDNGDLRLLRAYAGELEESYDVVMAHHTFEHMPDPHGTIETLRKLARRRIVITIPVPGFSWRKHGVNWAGVDAPRHLHILTPDGMRRLAEAHGLRVAHSYFEPDSFSLWASEQYAAGTPLHDPRSYLKDPSALSADVLVEYERQAWQLAAAGDGDAVVFLLEPRP